MKSFGDFTKMAGGKSDKEAITDSFNIPRKKERLLWQENLATNCILEQQRPFSNKPVCGPRRKLCAI